MRKHRIVNHQGMRGKKKYFTFDYYLNKFEATSRTMPSIARMVPHEAMVSSAVTEHIVVRNKKTFFTRVI